MCNLRHNCSLHSCNDGETVGLVQVSSDNHNSTGVSTYQTFNGTVSKLHTTFHFA